MVDRSNKESETFKIDFSRDDNHCKLFSMGVSLSITWNCKDAMSLSGSVLSVIGDKIKFEIDGIESFYSQDKFYENEFDIDMNKDFQIVWIRRSDNSVIRTNELVSSLLTNLLKAIHTRIIQRK
jgi:hypothetical protein